MSKFKNGDRIVVVSFEGNKGDPYIWTPIGTEGEVVNCDPDDDGDIYINIGPTQTYMDIKECDVILDVIYKSPLWAALK